jgi:hypothetical protein
MPVQILLLMGVPKVAEFYSAVILFFGLTAFLIA